MTTDANPYEVPYANDDDDTGSGSPVLEFTVHAAITPVNIGGTIVRAETFNGKIPGPTLRLNVNQTAVVRLVNDLPVPTGIHWHGIELANFADGTEVTQDGAVAGSPPVQMLGGMPGTPGVAVPAGGTYLYKFTVTRPGLYWYHPHHHNSLNRVFKGLYGMIVVKDGDGPGGSSLEDTIVSIPGTNRALPETGDTMQVVLSDITVSKGPMANDALTYSDYLAPNFTPTTDAAEWLALAATPTLTQQSGPQPVALCEIAPTGSATNDDGTTRTATIGDFSGTGSYPAGVVPSITQPPGNNTVEGQTVLTNGMNVGGRKGKPDGPLADVLLTGPGIPTPPTPRPVTAGQGIRLQIVNTATLRYFRLRLTYKDGGGVVRQVNLIRVGGEGGLLDNAILEGGAGALGTITAVGGATWNADYFSGEILLPPATRADVVAAIPNGLADDTILTLWTRDFKRVGQAGRGNWAQLPSVPVMHFTVSGRRTVGTEYTITGGSLATDPTGGTPLRTAAGIPTNDSQDLGPAAASTLLAGTTATATPDNIKMRVQAGVAPTIDGVPGMFETDPTHPTYADLEHLGSSRFAEADRVYVMKVTNTSGAHHPFHLHGFSFQPIRLDPEPGVPGGGTFVWPYREFRDTIDLPPHQVLTFRVRTASRPLADGTTPGGAFGRWLLHCHIFFHHHMGMISEFVVTSLDGTERPNVNVGGTWVFCSPGGRAERRVSFSHPTSGRTVTSLTPSRGTISGFVAGASGSCTWFYDSPAGDSARSEYVYITASDGTRQNQAVFRLQVGAAGTDTGSDWGDPHLVTADGKRYDFQSAGEFTLLRDAEGFEIQTRQTPAETPPPVTDEYSGLTACVSLNTAVAARVGNYRISFQPANALEGGHVVFLDGTPVALQPPGIDLDGHRASRFDTGGDEEGLRIDYANGTVVLVTPHLWDNYGIRYLDVAVSNSLADEGLMGRIPKSTWLPKLRNGATVGPRPDGLLDRYVALYRTFADSWRVTDETSMFVYAPRTSTATFTDMDWPPPPNLNGEFPVQPPCVLKPGFQKPSKPIERNIDLAEARRLCQDVTLGDLNEMCVFDVATTGDPTFARGYLVGQNLRLHSTKVQVVGDTYETHVGQPLVVTAIVAPLSSGRPTPTGTVTFMIDGVAVGGPVTLDQGGRASFTTKSLGIGEHMLRATYASDRTYHPSSSPNLLHTRREGGVHGTNVLRLPTAWIWILLLLLLLMIVITIAVYIASH